MTLGGFKAAFIIVIASSFSLRSPLPLRMKFRNPGIRKYEEKDIYT